MGFDAPPTSLFLLFFQFLLLQFRLKTTMSFLDLAMTVFLDPFLSQDLNQVMIM